MKNKHNNKDLALYGSIAGYLALVAQSNSSQMIISVFFGVAVVITIIRMQDGQKTKAKVEKSK